MSKPVRLSQREIDAMFWDRLLDMPDVEAEQELILRRDEISLQNAMLVQEKAKARNSVIERELGRAISENNALITKVNDELKVVRGRMDRLSWKNAVKAIYGEEGYFECLRWMEVSRA